MSKSEQIQASAIARFFSSAVLKELSRDGRSPMLARLIRESGLLNSNDTREIRTLLDDAFMLLRRRDNRHEYIYKAVLTKKILLGVHSLQTASMMTEFRVGRCKADVVILNGTGTVYEIKSERDSLTRLQNQTAEYRKVFATVNIIAGANHIDEILAVMPEDVGVLLLSQKHRISTIRESQDRPERTCASAIFDSITLSEAEKILAAEGITVPGVPNTQKFAAYKQSFQSLDSETAHRGFVKVLKTTRSLLPLQDLLNELPESLHTASMSVKLRKRDHERLIVALRTPVHEAVCWG